VVVLARTCLNKEFFEILDCVRCVVFFLFLEPSGLPRPRGLRAVVGMDGKSCGKGRTSDVSTLSESSVSKKGRRSLILRAVCYTFWSIKV
jgi:hypothetical protein